MHNATLKPLSDTQLRRSIYVSAILAMIVPPFAGGSIMGLVGFYPLPELYLIFLSYGGLYVAAFLFTALALVPRACRFVIGLPLLSPETASAKAQFVFSRLPWYLLFVISIYSIGGVPVANYSLAAMGIRTYTLEEHFYHLFGLVPVVLITIFPLFFFFIDRLGRYLGPRGVTVTAIPLWVKMFMLGIVTPLLIDSLLLGYFYNRTGFFEWETLFMWVTLVGVAIGGTWLAWRSLSQSLNPLQNFLNTDSASIYERASTTLMPLSLDELGVLTSRYAQMLATQQKLTGELQRAQWLAESVIDNAGALVLALDHEGRIVRFNRACEALSGLSFAEVKGKFPWETFLPPEDAELIRKNAFEIFANNQQPLSGRYSNNWVTHNGGRALTEWSNTVLLDNEGRMEHVISVGMDITERKRTLQLLEDSEARLNAAQHIAKVGSWELDLINNHLHWSDEIFNLFEIEKTQFAATYEAFLHGIHPDDRDRVNQAYSASLVDRSPYEIVHRLLMKDGRIKYVRETCESIFDTDGKALRSIGTVQDISDLYKAEEALRQQRDRLEETVQYRTAALKFARDAAESANAAKSEFLSRMSHELRTPLNAILGFGQLLEIGDGHPLSATQTDNVREIIHAGNHLLELISEILDLSRIESGRLHLKLAAIPISPMIEACTKQMQPLAKQKNIRITVASASDEVVLGDLMRLREVLINLLSNAIKYNRDGGEVHISYTAVAGQRLHISVRDTGRGIAAQFLPQLFKPFERNESAYDGIEGSGIGLALAKKLVEAMQGEIGVETIEGNGSTFWFELPLVVDRESGGVIPKRKLLYIEDNPANLRLVQKIIALREDLAMFDATNATDGIAIAVKQLPDIILLDIQLPDMDGFEALRRLRENPHTRGIPVIAVSANAMPQDIERSKAAGFCNYITKPIDVSNFFVILEQCLTNHTNTPR